MDERTTEELLEEFRAVLFKTVDGYEDEGLKYHSDQGASDWSMNDGEDGMIIDGISRRDLVKVLAHAVILLSHEEEAYYKSVNAEAESALDSIEASEESDDEEKILACSYLEEAVRGQLDGFSHCVALIHGWAKAAVLADEGATVDWDDIFKEGTVNE